MENRFAYVKPAIDRHQQSMWNEYGLTRNNELPLLDSFQFWPFQSLLLYDIVLVIMTLFFFLIIIAFWILFVFVACVGVRIL